MTELFESPAMPHSGDGDMLANFRAYRASHDLAIRDQLVCKHMHLVQSVARRFSGLGETLDDLLQEGAIGLLKAVDQYDADRGVKFSTYACHLIASQIQHYLRDRGRLIRQPAWVQELNTKVARATEQLTQELGRDPQLAEVAERLQLSEASINNALAARELNSVISLSSPTDMNSDNDVSVTEKESLLGNKISAEQLSVEDRLNLDEAIETLKTLEQQVVRLFFFQDLNQSEIARKLGISVNYASYLLRRSTSKLRTILENQRSEERAAMQNTVDPDMFATADLPTYDRFTGLYTAVYLRARIAEEIARGRRYPSNFAVLIAEVEGLPTDEGEMLPLVMAVGQVLRQGTRIIDLSAYEGSGRFALLLPHTGREARVLAERLCRQVGNLSHVNISADSPLQLTTGFAVFPMDGSTVDKLFQRAATALLVAKRPVVDAAPANTPMGGDVLCAAESNKRLPS